MADEPKIPTKKLAALLTLMTPDEEDEIKAKLPMLAEVVYCGPNTDGSRKQCANCVLWAEMDKRCLLHSRDLEISYDQVCSYHVYGEPQLFATAINGHAMTPLDPELSGLERTDGGSSCDGCKAFEPRGRSKGICTMTVDSKGNPAEVEARGCCARYTKA